MKTPDKQNKAVSLQNGSSPIAEMYKKIQKLKNKDSILLSVKKYSKEQIEMIIKKLKDNATVLNLWLQQNKMPKMVYFVSLHCYANLQVLNLGGNDLVSVEPLVRADMPNLEELWLWKNRLTDISSLRKLYAPKLRGVDVSNNYIKQWRHFEQMVSKKILEIDLTNNPLVYVDNLLKNLHFNPLNVFVIGVEKTKLVRAFNKHTKNDEGSPMLALTLDEHCQLDAEYSP